MTQNNQKFCQLHSISQKPYIIWLPFVVHKCKMISQGIFYFFFSKFWFFELLGVSKDKNGQKWQKNLTFVPYISGTMHQIIFIYGAKWQKIMSLVLHISGNLRHMIMIYGKHVQNDDISKLFFHFFKISIFQVITRVKGHKMVQSCKTFCLSYSVSQEPYLIW